MERISSVRTTGQETDFVSVCDLQTWTPHYFVLTSNKIYYSEETSHYQTNDEEEEDDGKEVEMEK